MAAKKKLPARKESGGPAPGAEAMRSIEKGKPTAEGKSPASQAPERSASRTTQDRDVIERKDGRRLRKKQIYFDAEVGLRMAVYCTRENIDMSDYVNALVAQDLKRLGA